MSEIRIQDASARQLENWDAFNRASVNGTIFQQRNFLAYHGDKFANQKFLVVLNGQTVIAQIAMCTALVDGKLVARSPYGGSYGGFVFAQPCDYKCGREIVSAFISLLREMNIDRFIVTPPMAICEAQSLDVFRFNLLEQGFKSTSRDISNVALLQGPEPIFEKITSEARNKARKAKADGVVIRRRAPVGDFWIPLAATFDKHGTPATHTRAELEYLVENLPKEVWVDVAYYNEQPIAGICHFVINKNIDSGFYLVQNPQMRQYRGLTLLVAEALSDAQQAGFKYFDFGTSSIGMVARENVFSFKESFSKVGYFRESFDWVKN